MIPRFCAWCRRELPATLGPRARFHGRKCRQAYWRVRRASLLQASDGTPKRGCYADPPFPGLSRKYYRNESSYAGEVDHAALVAELRAFDGWALSTSAKALRDVWNLCPEARLAVWVKPQPPRNKRTRGAHNVFECVLFVPTRSAGPLVPDALVAGAARGDGSNLPGRKPRRFCQWLFQLLGLREGDQLVDRFPGSGIVGRVWLASSGAGSDGASPGDGSDAEASSVAGSDGQRSYFGGIDVDFWAPEFDSRARGFFEGVSFAPGGDAASLKYSSDGASAGAPSDGASPRAARDAAVSLTPAGDDSGVQ